MARASKRIPTILGLILLLAGLGAGMFLVGKQIIQPRATAEETPKEIKITNVSENSFTVSWLTEIATVGYVKYGTSGEALDQTIQDERDELSGEVGSFMTHSVKVENLRPSTNYYFKIGSGARQALFGNELSGGKPYQVTTPVVLGTPPAADTIYGTVMEREGKAAEGALVYVTLPNAMPLSSLTKTGGNWAVSLSTARSGDLASYAAYDRQATTLSIFVQAAEGKTATAVTVTANDTPVPTIFLGQTHDFRSDKPVQQEEEIQEGGLPPGAEIASAVEAQEASASSSFDLTPLAQQESTYVLEIVNPETDGEEVTTTKPEIFGTSPKNVTLNIVVESPATFSDEIEVGENGWWQWAPPKNLEPGEHRVTVSYTDASGVERTAERTFVVLAAGNEELPSFEATPAATTTPATSSGEMRASMPSTQSGVPTAGVLTPTLTLFILGLSLAGIGMFWQLSLARHD